MDKPMHTVYQLTITTLSPLHIGTGNTLRRGYDYVTHQGKTWIVDTTALADTLYDRDSHDFDDMVQGAPADQLLQPQDYDPQNPLFRYVMRGEPRSKKQGSEIQELLKDAWDRPYIPGSSLKGALRTALAFVGWEARGMVFSVNDLGDRVKSAAQPLERRLLVGKPDRPGNIPNYDLLRALQVSDSTPDDERRLSLLNVQVITGSKAASPIELEAIPYDTTFAATLTLDGFLRRDDIANQLGWESDQLKWLKVIPQAVNHFTKARLDREWTRWQDTQAPIRSFYVTLHRTMRELDERKEFVLQLGWGGGWDSKTFGDHLTAHPEAFYQVVKRFENQMDRQHNFKKGDRFPKSRRVAMRNEEPVAPLGWIKVGMERVK